MPKTKPNEPCPCGSKIKYKKCCSLREQQNRIQLASQFQEILEANEKGPIESEQLQELNTYFLDRYRIPCVDLTSIVTSCNIKRLHQHYMNKNMVMLIQRTDVNDSAFTCKGAKSLEEEDYEDIMIIYGNNFLQFRYATERDTALKAIEDWFKKSKRR